MSTVPHPFIRANKDPRATTEEVFSSVYFKYDPGEQLVLVMTDGGNHSEWSAFRTVEDQADALHLCEALNAVLALFEGTAG